MNHGLHEDILSWAICATQLLAGFAIVYEYGSSSLGLLVGLMLVGSAGWPFLWYRHLCSRSRHVPDVVGSNRGGADAEGAMATDEPPSGPTYGESPPSEALPFPAHIGEACNPWLAVRRRRR